MGVDGSQQRRRTVGLVDDDPGVRRALCRLLRSAGHEVLAFATAEECLERLPREGTDCLVVDLRLPGIDGLALQESLAARGVATQIVFLTGHGDVPSSVAALKHGAIDFLEKPVEDERLLAAVDEAIERTVARRAERREVDGIRRDHEELTPREREVMEEVVAGRLNKQIAGRLGIAEGTVKVHRGQVMRKMRAGSLAELVRMAERLGIGTPDAG